MIKKNKLAKRIGTVFLTAFTIIGSINTNIDEVQAKSYWPEGPKISTPSAIVMEVNTGTVLYDKKSHKKNYPASITKILTTLLSIENSELDEVVTFSADAVYKNEGDTSNIARDLDEKMTMEQCLYGVMLESANECAYAVAEHVGQKLGGDYSTFVDLMNKKAKELGCKDTHFNNSNGLPDEKHITSAYDMALISCAAYKNEAFKTITGTESYMIPPTNKHKDPTPLNNHHKILHLYESGNYVNEYCTGGKTGYTTVANHTLVTYAEKDGMTICVVVMNSNSPGYWNDTNTLIDYCFNNYHALNISENEKSVAEKNAVEKGILNNNGRFVTLDENAYIVLPNTVEFSEAEFERDEDIEDKDTIAVLKYSYAGHEVGSVQIVTTGVKVEESYYKKNVEENKEEKSDDSNIIRIKPIHIFIIAGMVVLLMVLIVVLKKVYDNYYWIRHNRQMKKARLKEYKSYEKKRRKPNKHDISFK